MYVQPHCSWVCLARGRQSSFQATCLSANFIFVHPVLVLPKNLPNTHPTVRNRCPSTGSRPASLLLGPGATPTTTIPTLMDDLDAWAVPPHATCLFHLNMVPWVFFNCAINFESPRTLLGNSLKRGMHTNTPWGHCAGLLTNLKASLCTLCIHRIQCDTLQDMLNVKHD